MKSTLIILSLILVSSFEPPTGNDYKKIFGNDYVWAVNWLKKHDSLIEQHATIFKIPARELKSIVFPELIRYNGVLDAIEIESLKYLYVKEGKYYSDFSIGYFQMKPSFAEMVEKDGRKLLGTGVLDARWEDIMKEADDENSRKERVRRLADTRQQIIYLCMFYKICESRFKNRTFATPVERLRLFATCYNAGYRRSYESLLAFQQKNQFFKYNYSSISAYFYLQEDE